MYNNKVKILIFLVTTALIVLMFPHGESLDSEVTVGSIWTKPDLIATMSFEILKDPNVYETERRRAAMKVYPVFVRDKSAKQKCLSDFSNFFDSLKTIIAVLPDSALDSVALPVSPQTLRTLRKLKNKQNLVSSSGIKISGFKKILQNTLAEICAKGVLDLSYGQIKRDTISVRDDKFQSDFVTETFFDRETAKEYFDKTIFEKVKYDTAVARAGIEIGERFIVPTLKYSEVFTSRARQAAMDKVPRNLGIVNENERIVAKHDRITPEIKLKIDSYRIAKGEEKNVVDTVLEYFGKTLHVTIILILYGLYLFLSRKKIYGNNKFLLLIAIIILFTAVQAYFIQFIDVKAPVDFLVLVPLASMLLTILFDSRVAFFGTVAIAMLVGGLRGNDYIITLTHISAGGFAAYTVRDIKNRNQIFRSFFYILAGYILAIFAFGFERFLSLEDILVESSFAATNALISPVLTFGFLFIVEKFFGISTDLTFLELSDFNNPLLRELAQRAPGTFNHSTVIGTMVEEAASLIGANSLLARVGAYYHDIGKLYYPEAFAENQFEGENIHENLTPQESAKIIIAHVDEGIKMAKEHDLPQEIIDFIPMHHGTLLAAYFYEKAKKLYGEENVNEEDFRYKGPKPNTKETGLLMLADACESAVRSMRDIDPQKVENLVSNIVESRLRDGQLDDSNLNFRHIKLIKDTFVRVLLNQHHKRVRYPNQDEMENTNVSEKETK